MSKRKEVRNKMKTKGQGQDICSSLASLFFPRKPTWQYLHERPFAMCTNGICTRMSSVFSFTHETHLSDAPEFSPTVVNQYKHEHKSTDNIPLIIQRIIKHAHAVFLCRLRHGQHQWADYNCWLNSSEVQQTHSLSLRQPSHSITL